MVKKLEDDFSKWIIFIRESLKYLTTEVEKLRENKVDKNSCSKHIDGMDKILNELNNIKIEMGINKIKFGLWGALGASLPIIGMLIIQFFLRD